MHRIELGNQMQGRTEQLAFPVALAALALGLAAQAGEHAAPPWKEALPKVVVQIGSDQRAIWMSPFHWNRRQAGFWVPATIATAGLVLADRRMYRGTLEGISPGAQSRMGDFSRAGNPLYMFGLAGGLWLLGSAPSDNRLRRTAWLTTRALVNDMIVVDALKFATGRRRPLHGCFGGPRDALRGQSFRSFPSGHASAAWTVAAVVSSRHRKRWVPVLFYGFAAAVSLTRVAGGRHFYGDAVAGGLIGYGIGKMVARSEKDAP